MTITNEHKRKNATCLGVATCWQSHLCHDDDVLSLSFWILITDIFPLCYEGSHALHLPRTSVTYLDKIKHDDKIKHHNSFRTTAKKKYITHVNFIALVIFFSERKIGKVGMYNIVTAKNKKELIRGIVTVIIKKLVNNRPDYSENHKKVSLITL